MATCSSILAWRIPWTQEPDTLQSMGSQRIRHNWVTECKCTHTHTHTHTHCPVGGSGSNHVLFAWLKSGLNGGLHLKMLRCQNFPGMLWRIASMLGRIIRCTSNFHPWCTHLWGKTCEYGRMSLLGLDSVFLKGGMCQIQLRLLISWLWVHQNGGDPEQAWSGLFRGESNYSWDSLSLYTMKKSRYRTGRV